MRNRPLFHCSSAQLEELFYRNKNNIEICSDIREELRFRKTIRAKNLNSVVAAHIKETAAGAMKAMPATHSKREPAKITVDLSRHPPLAEPVGRQTASNEFPISRLPVTNHVQDVLRAWTALEVLSPQGFRREVDLAGGEPTRIAWLDRGDLPWKRGEKSRPKYRLFYELILGTIDLGTTVDTLLRAYTDDRPNPPNVATHAPLASIILDREGHPLDDDASLTISSFAWGAPVALQGDLARLGDWKKEERQLRQSFRDQLIKQNDDGSTRVLTKQSINHLYQFLVRMLNLDHHNTSPPTFAIRQYIYFTNKSLPETSILNSFFLEDLSLARSLHRASRLPKSLHEYIIRIGSPADKDLLKDDAAIRDLLQPNRTPLGRWPSPGRYSLSLFQQAAVNASTEDQTSAPILAVNGPPGTGKTTLLRDVVAARVVERAQVMASFSDPACAFTPTDQTLTRNAAQITLHRIDKRLKGFEIVVASSNNKAVENISAEFPSADAVSTDTNLRYLKTVSDHILGRNTWGLISAVLGNSSNRFHFSQSFWRDAEHGLSTLLNYAAGSCDAIVERDGEVLRKRLHYVVSHEDPPSTRREALRRWETARTAFKQATDKALATQQRFQALHESVERISNLKILIADTVSEIEALQLHCQSLAERRSDVSASADAIFNRLQDADQRLAQHMRTKPGTLSRLMRRRSARDWQADCNYLELESADLADRKRSLLSLLSECDEDLDLARHRLDHLRSKDAQRSARLTQESDFVARETADMQAPILDDDFFLGSNDQVQQAHPWFDRAQQIERDEVFETAIRLHEAFLYAAADPIRQNLSIFTESYGTRSLGSEGKDRLVGDLWSTFFLAVPVVSTTFASVHRMFSRLAPETLGWLLIDEAGQALPQAAVGALMRTKRALVVGDPLQIEPVVTLPPKLTQEICAQFGIDSSRYNPPEASAQTLADAASPYKAQFPIGSGYRTVGLPLLVHRRCSSPMFEISNEIAYANKMVQAKPTASEAPILGPSRWIHVEGTPGPDKWCAEEGNLVVDLLTEMRSRGRSPDLYLVTPFVDVQNKLRRELISSGVLHGWVDGPEKWPYERVGTVHTVQGREADMVILVLGAQSSTQAGARNWAGGRPNLLNVAVTRAKSSLYVIGNRELWREAGVFSTLHRLLP